MGDHLLHLPIRKGELIQGLGLLEYGPLWEKSPMEESREKPVRTPSIKLGSSVKSTLCKTRVKP